MIINTAGQYIGVQMLSTDLTAFTGTVTVYVTKDGGSQTLGSVSSGVCTAVGNGFYRYAPSQTETNAAHVAFTFIGTDAIPQTVQVDTEYLVETGFTQQQANRLVLAALVGKLSGGGTGTVTIRDINDTVNRIVASVESAGNRLSVTTNTA